MVGQKDKKKQASARRNPELTCEQRGHLAAIQNFKTATESNDEAGHERQQQQGSSGVFSFAAGARGWAANGVVWSGSWYHCASAAPPPSPPHLWHPFNSLLLRLRRNDPFPSRPSDRMPAHRATYKGETQQIDFVGRLCCHRRGVPAGLSTHWNAERSLPSPNEEEAAWEKNRHQRRC